MNKHWWAPKCLGRPRPNKTPDKSSNQGHEKELKKNNIVHTCRVHRKSRLHYRNGILA